MSSKALGVVLGIGGLASAAEAAAQSPAIPPGAEAKAPATAPATKPASLEESSQWKLITETWKQAVPLAISHRSTTKQRHEVGLQLGAAAKAAKELADAGLLSMAEAGLLRAETESLFREIVRDAPIDSQVTCYLTLFVPPARLSLERLEKRLPMLEQLARSGKVSRPALDKVLPTIEADLRILADPGAVNQIPADRQKAQDTRKRVELQLAEVRKLAQ